jgi:hypothetical protein
LGERERWNGEPETTRTGEFKTGDGEGVHGDRMVAT